MKTLEEIKEINKIKDMNDLEWFDYAFEEWIMKEPFDSDKSKKMIECRKKTKKL